MQVSVVMATYNGERYILEQLDSLARQTVYPAELIVSDDGSSDRTLDIVREFASTAPFPVRILTKDKNLGYANNFLYGATHCTHELVAFCDQDDVWLPNKIKVERDRIIADGSVLALHVHMLTDANLHPIEELKQGIQEDKVCEPLTTDPNRNAWGNTMMFRREILTSFPYKNRPYKPQYPDRPLSHDKWIYALASGLGRISEIREPLALYRQHGKNIYGFSKKNLVTTFLYRVHISMWRFREKMVYFKKMSEIFYKISQDSSSPFKENAERSYLFYKKMSDDIRSRLDIYYNRSFFKRAHAWKELYGGSSFLKSSPIKDLIVGVSGFHFFLKQTA